MYVNKAVNVLLLNYFIKSIGSSGKYFDPRLISRVCQQNNNNNGYSNDVEILKMLNRNVHHPKVNENKNNKIADDISAMQKSFFLLNNMGYSILNKS